MECGCTKVKIILADSDLVSGYQCAMHESDDTVAVLYNRDFIDLVVSLIGRALEGTNAEDYGVQRAIGALATHSILNYERMKRLSQEVIDE